MGRNRGFTLIELLVAGTISLLVVAGAFVVLTRMQAAAARQAEANELVANARMAMEVMARDLRSAGDSLDLLDAHCLGASASPDARGQCPAILEPHPWRVAIARNAWTDAAGGRSRYRADDLPPATTRAFDAEPENVVIYRFVPREDAAPLTDADGTTRNAVIGRIERVVNPYDFPRGATPQTAQVSVLLDNVLLDDRMRVNPVNPAEIDHRYDFSLFMYQLLTKKGELLGGLSDRATSLGETFLTPPLRFFAPEAPPALVKARPWAPDTAARVVGLDANTTVRTALLATASGGMKASEPDSDLRLVLDRNRIRAVRIAFKVVGPERSDIRDGIDLDGNPANGTARVYSFESTAELKPLAHTTEI